MAQKRKSDHSKKKAGTTGNRRTANPLDGMAELLEKIEEQTARAVRNRLGDNWRENLFEIVMTRIDFAAPHKKKFIALRDAFRADPKALARSLPRFTRTYCGTMKRILQLADAPAYPHHIAAFSVLYATIIDTFLKDDTRDHSKTMAALDKRLGYFERFVEFSKCRALH